MITASTRQGVEITCDVTGCVSVLSWDYPVTPVVTEAELATLLGENGWRVTDGGQHQCSAHEETAP